MQQSVKMLIKQRRLRLLVITIAGLVVVLGVLIVPVERAGGGLITSVGTGIWWAVTAISGAGYGGVHPVTSTGQLLGMVLEVGGTLAFGLLVAIIAVTITHREEQFYWKRLFERLEEMEKKLDDIEKKEEFEIKKGVK